MLTQNNLGNLPIITQGLASVGIHDFSAGPSAYARDTSGIWHDDFHNNRYREVDNVPTEDVAPKPFVDNFQEDYSDSGSTRSGSEPDEIDSDASVAYEETADFGEGMSSQQQAPFNAPMPSTTNEPELYPVIQFFSTTHPEVHCDSTDIPSSRLKFYDESSGKISKNMVFNPSNTMDDVVAPGRGGVNVETGYQYGDAPMQSHLAEQMAQIVARADSMPEEDETFDSLMAFRHRYTTIARQVVHEDNRRQHRDAQQ
ncbi:hypothetical protein BUALT_Bualt02G0037200 [Buddleja alternifolia]|uniref:Uncharacterized protein n=1 Tax=Buddleja alternifolia TaxID=168488 RepID=A0AAV6XX34_9LAMI|nr:hypothetical protein BUALT_Bualt02G0037200 [Buddleja alternifolia]